MLSKIGNLVYNRDNLTSKGYTHFKIDGDKRSKSLLGAVGSLTISCYVTYVAVIKGY